MVNNAVEKEKKVRKPEPLGELSTCIEIGIVKPGHVSCHFFVYSFFPGEFSNIATLVNPRRNKGDVCISASTSSGVDCQAIPGAISWPYLKQIPVFVGDRLGSESHQVGTEHGWLVNLISQRC